MLALKGTPVLCEVTPARDDNDNCMDLQIIRQVRLEIVAIGQFHVTSITYILVRHLQVVMRWVLSDRVLHGTLSAVSDESMSSAPNGSESIKHSSNCISALTSSTEHIPDKHHSSQSPSSVNSPSSITCESPEEHLSSQKVKYTFARDSKVKKDVTDAENRNNSKMMTVRTEVILSVHSTSTVNNAFSSEDVPSTDNLYHGPNISNGEPRRVRYGENPQNSEAVHVTGETTAADDSEDKSVRKRSVIQTGASFLSNECDEPEQYMRIREDEGEEEEEEPLPIIRKLCFAVGGAPYQICSTVIGFFLNIFLLEVAQIPPKYISIILFGGKAWDAISDPLCGYLVNKTNTRWGKMRPWILLSAPFACVSYFFLWYVPDVSDEAKLGFYFVMFCTFEGLLSGLHVPYTSLTMYISNNQKERDSATAYRMVSEAVGVLIGVIVQGKLIEKYRTAGDCKEPDATPSPQQLSDQKWSYMEGSLIVVGIYIFCAVTVFVGVKEKRKGVVDARGDTGFFAGLKIVFTYKPYVKAAMVFLFVSLAVSIIQGNLALYCTHSLDLGDQFSDFILVLLLVSICCMPVWQLILTKFGKKTAYAAGIIILIPILIGHLYLPRGNPYFYYVTVAIAGLSISVTLLLPWSILPDVLDLFMLERKTRKDALFYSFYVFFNKFSAGLGLAVSQLALEYGGYETGACLQPHSVDLTLRLLIVPGPVLCLILGLLFLWSYPINEKKRIQIKQEVLEIMAGSKTHDKDDLERSSMSYESIKVTSSTEF